ncbi:MAG: response regulator [Gammaproteobacteria bacterium]
MIQLKAVSNRLLVVAVAGVSLLLVLLSVLSIQYTNRMVSQYSTLVATSIEVKLEIATAHLWFEEIISGDQNESLDNVWRHHNKASYYIREILEGNSDPLVNVGYVDSPQIRQKLREVEGKLAVFREISLERINSNEYAGVGSEIDQKYDAVFIDLLNNMDTVIDELKSLSRNDLEQFHLIQLLLILLTLITASIIGIILYFYQKRLIILLNKQLEINQSLNDSHTRLQDIAFCAGDWVWEVDTEGHYTYASENVVDIIGYYPDEIIGRTPFELMSAKESERVSALFAEVVTAQGKITDLDNWNIHKNGELVCLRTNGLPVFNANGQLTGYRGVDKDVTEQKEMNDLLMRTQKMDALGKLTGGIAHDFNNLLGVILGYAELLQNKLPVDDKLNKYVHQINNAAERAKKLTAKLLTFTRKESSSTEETDINELLRDDQHMLEKTLTARIKLDYELEVDLWPVCLDKSALQDSILNISINAMHAITGTGGLTITTQNVSLDAESARQLNVKPGDYAVISFFDTGTGMDEVTQQKVFDPFFTTKGDSGIGLGLSQVYGFVQQSHGAIHVSSQPGLGTQMVIYLPRYFSSVAIETELKTVTSSWDYSGGETILVVDDEEALCSLANEVLVKHGYKVLCASSSEKALEILETETVDLLFSDVIMPGMDGYELASRVKKDYPNIKIQMASGFSDMRHKSEFDKKLHQQRLLKPYSSKLFLHRIRALLDR